jgi:hypothetical protein
MECKALARTRTPTAREAISGFADAIKAGHSLRGVSRGFRHNGQEAREDCQGMADADFPLGPVAASAYTDDE